MASFQATKFPKDFWGLNYIKTNISLTSAWRWKKKKNPSARHLVFAADTSLHLGKTYML